uniref:Odorant-binding protein 18 n=1 Tax=Adelphocoris lineolatus TaxID=236346 RepID=A0A346RVG3_ADELI|nr:odorant-binding protein 18 [Adelphocoris lineolatus]
MNTLLLCAVIAVSACFAYDFSDPEFNIIIDDELFDIAEGKDTLLRNRRDIDDDDERMAFEQDEADDPSNGPPDHLSEMNDENSHHKGHCKRHHKSCCGKTPLPLSLIQHGKNETKRSTGSECYEEIDAKMGNKTSLENDMDPYNCEKVKRMKKKQYCMHECKAKKMGVANEQGVLDFPKVKDLLLSRVNETWQKEVLGQAVDTCATSKFDQTWKDDQDEYKCNPQALQFKHCVWKQVELKCPEEYQNTGRHCKKLRTKLTSETNKETATKETTI